ncbi:GNAT family N-acetyltransferase [Pseudalkalibacillus sp. R45]|uniref:GNAT family N-acetyltransferase n=1 Tax=Pseudalkalibacillus sp. R45 TaxID=3457433 RepID=UPI003FCD2AFF
MIDLSNKPIITGDKTILRPFKMDEDFPSLEECLNDPVVLKYTGSSPEYNREKVYHWYHTRNAQKDRLDLAIIDKISNTLVGEGVVNLFDEENQSMNFRILIGALGRNRGLGTEATRLMVDYVFENTILNQLTLSVFDFNSRAKKLYEKVGFIVESIDKDDLEFEGELIDSINMKLTKEDWLNNKK